MSQEDKSLQQLKSLRDQKAQRNQKMKMAIRKLQAIAEKIDRQKSLQAAEHSLKGL